ncbi:MAG: ribosome silencing factor [Clostridiaceae bacterium]|nr:ribosome silencing factor [Clostridiaceae bacterium]
MESAALAEKIAEILKEKKALDIDILDVSKLTILTDCFVICSGTSTIHIRTLADELGLKLKETGVSCHHIEGYETARWILLDYGNVVVHIFHEEERKFYNLERLWSDSMIKRKS